MKQTFILVASDDALIQLRKPRDSIIATFTTEDLARFYQHVYGLTHCTKILPIKKYTSKEQILK